MQGEGGLWDGKGVGRTCTVVEGVEGALVLQF